MHTDLKALSPVERQQILLAWIEERRRAGFPEIVEAFGISLATARRDVEALAAGGKVQRVHGAVLAMRRVPPEAPVIQRAQEQPAEKQRIAAATAALIADGETVFLGSGTTVEAVARLLGDRHTLTVLTNSLLVLNALSAAPGVTLISLGGTLRATELSFIGPLTMNALGELRKVKVIMGIRAIDPVQGLTNAYLDESLIDRAIISIGSEVILVADHTKCSSISTVFVAPVENVDLLVTDRETAPEFIAMLRERGVRVIAV